MTNQQCWQEPQENCVGVFWRFLDGSALTPFLWFCPCVLTIEGNCVGISHE